MQRNTVMLMVAIGAGLLAASALGQVTKIGSNAKVCELLPIPALEAHFGAKVSSIHGADGTVSQCTAQVPDLVHAATVITRPGSSPQTIEQRLRMYEEVEKLGGPRIAQIKNFGSVACYTSAGDTPADNMQTATCFLETGGHLSLGLQSENAGQVTYEAVKALLEQAAKRRK